MGVAVVEGEESGADAVARPVSSPLWVGSPATPAPLPFRLDGLLLLDSAGNDPVAIDALTFGDEGIGVVRSPGELPRVLPWSSVANHVVEPWAGGIIPEWWVDPELNRPQAPVERSGVVTDPAATNRALPHAEAGALIAVQTPYGTYRFLLPRGDPKTLSDRITAFAVRHRGPSGASSVTTVVRPEPGARRHRRSGSAAPSSWWSKAHPFLVVALILFIAAAVTLILLQSAGTIHLPLLGGSNPGTVGVVRFR
jgi:hypothetical protein